MIWTNTPKNLRIVAALAGLGPLALVGCASSPASDNASGAKTKVPLVVYSAQGYDTARPTPSEGDRIPVSLDDNSTGPLLTQIEASKNNPKWGCCGSMARPPSPALTPRACS